MASQGKSLSPFGHALAGSGGAVLALTITIKTRLQVQTKDSKYSTQYTSIQDALYQIVKKEGLSGLYAGLPSGLIGVASTNFAYFYWYSLIRGSYMRLLQRRSGQKAIQIGVLMELVLGALAAAVSQIFTIPVAVITTRQQTQVVVDSAESEDKGGKKSQSKETSKSAKSPSSTATKRTLPATRRWTMLETASVIIEEDGWTGLWRGLKPSLVLCINPAITYGLFERMKTAYADLTPGGTFMLGLISKTVATVVTYPYIMAKVRLQWKPQDYAENKQVQYKSALDVLERVYKSDGFFGMYKGMKAQIFKAVLTQALLFVLKDKLTLYTYLLFAFVRHSK